MPDGHQQLCNNTNPKTFNTLYSCLTPISASASLASMADPHSMPDLLSVPAGPGALSAPAPQHGEVPPGRISTDAALSVPLLPSFGPGSCATQGQSSEACTFPPHHAAPGPIPSAGSGRGAAGPDTSDDALPPSTPMDPRLGARPVRIDATRTAYAGYSTAEQPPLGGIVTFSKTGRTWSTGWSTDSNTS